MQTPDSPGATLFDSIRNSLLALAEIGGNRLLGLDEDALAHCREMQGHCIAVDITDLDIQLYCHPGDWGIRLSRNPPARAVDATICGRLMALVNLASQEDRLSTSIRERVSFHGNVELAQKLQRIFAGLDIDWEEALAQRTGDVLAFQIHRRVRVLGAWLKQGAGSLLQTSSEYLREEARLSPTRVEFDDFQSRLTELKHDAARAEARLTQLLEKARSR
ncbi:MAG: SCP2 sterol-binding domain-containing protein [Gammaproteobacteria bacterium]|nr:SCP2 sterol-binding domain-containing protein [Gammaproteobacteria bacterium]